MPGVVDIIPVGCDRRTAQVDHEILLVYYKSMKVTVEISDSELKEVCHVTGERKKGPAIRKLVVDALMLKRRAALTQKFISGEWGAELAGFEAGQAADLRDAAARAQRWRG